MKSKLLSLVLACSVAISSVKADKLVSRDNVRQVKDVAAAVALLSSLEKMTAKDPKKLNFEEAGKIADFIYGATAGALEQGGISMKVNGIIKEVLNEKWTDADKVKDARNKVCALALAVSKMYLKGQMSKCISKVAEGDDKRMVRKALGVVREVLLAVTFGELEEQVRARLLAQSVALGEDEVAPAKTCNYPILTRACETAYKKAASSAACEIVGELLGRLMDETTPEPRVVDFALSEQGRALLKELSEKNA